MSLSKIALAACVLLASAPAVGAATRAGAALRQRRAGRTTERRQRPLRRPDVIYVPTPPETVDEMLRQARLEKDDLLIDLGSGDGRIPLAAARQYRVRAIGIDIDPKLVEEATQTAKREGLDSLVNFRLGDMFAADLSGATVVTLYLSDRLNVLLRPKLLRELPVGARIVSHDFRMGDWPPEKSVRVPWKNLYRTVYVWTVPRGRRYKKGSSQ